MRLLLFIAIIVAAVSCTDATGSLERNSDSLSPGYTGGIPVIFESTRTKVDIDGATGVPSWTEGDRIAFCTTNGSSTGYTTAAINALSGDINVSLASGYYRTNYAIYPEAAKGTDYSTPTVVYPDSYNLDLTGTETYSPCPMVADNTSDAMVFYHVGGLLRIAVFGIPEATSYIQVAFTGPEYVTGVYTVSDAGTATAATTLFSGSRNYVTFTKSSWGSSQYLNVPLPSGITVTEVTVTAYNSSSSQVGAQASFPVSWTSLGRATGKQLAADLEKKYKFNNMIIAPGPMYYTAGGYSIHEDWNHFNVSENLTEGGTYFSFVQLGKVFDADGNSFSASSGNIDNSRTLTWGGHSGWRVPTQSEWANITTNTGARNGSTVNGNARKHYAHIRLDGGRFLDDYSPYGLLLFPDGETITGKALSDMDNTNINPLTPSELNVYLDQGCVFLPDSGYISGGSWVISVTMGGVTGYYWSATQHSSSYGYCLAVDPPNASYNFGKSSTYLQVRLVRPAE